MLGLIHRSVPRKKLKAASRLAMKCVQNVNRSARKSITVMIRKLKAEPGSLWKFACAGDAKALYM